MMWGKHKENGIWIAPRKRAGWYRPKLLIGGGRIVYLALGRFRLRLVWHAKQEGV